MVEFLQFSSMIIIIGVQASYILEKKNITQTLIGYYSLEIIPGFQEVGSLHHLYYTDFQTWNSCQR